MMTLGELIDAIPNNDEQVFFGFCGAFPVLSFGSYRGFYERGAIDWTVRRRSDDNTNKPTPPTGRQLRAFLLSQLGTTMEGYKGGTYPVDRHTLVHVDGHGEYNNTPISSVEVLSYMTVIHTESDQ